jgi:hypothetical protein
MNLSILGRMNHPCCEAIVHVETHYIAKIQCKHDPTNVKPKRVARVKSANKDLGAQNSHHCLSCGIYYWGLSGGTVIYCDDATGQEGQQHFMVCDAKVCTQLLDEATTGYDEVFFGYANTSEWYKFGCTGGPESTGIY